MKAKKKIGIGVVIILIAAISKNMDIVQEH